MIGERIDSNVQQMFFNVHEAILAEAAIGDGSCNLLISLSIETCKCSNTFLLIK
jgi:hypothetical protein